MPSPIVTATAQSALLAATSNVLAQVITSYQAETPLVVDWVPIFQFVVYAFLNIPPNFLWQEFLEATFPATHISPTREAIASASKGSEKELEEEAAEGKLVEPRLNKGNTAIKLVLDQTIGAAVNTFLFSLFIHGIQATMPRPFGTALSAPEESGRYLSALLSGAVKTGKVDWGVVVQQSTEEFWPIMQAGWKLWPFVSLVNFAFIKSIEGRNLVGSLAGVVWGIYMSMISAR
ncbi:Mpv17/PMP22 family protein [Xylariaceae sp. FL0016]|nr:Mpv17/PMP22 family protein [Xylariaceae sp. FL0016]